MAKIDLLSDALNFSEEEQPKKKAPMQKDNEVSDEGIFELDLNLDEQISEESVTQEREDESVEEIQEVFENAEPVDDTPSKKIKLDFKDEGESLDEELENLVQSELQEEKAETVQIPRKEEISEVPVEEPEPTPKKAAPSFPEDEENIVRPNPFYQGKDSSEDEYEYESFEEEVEREGGGSKRLIILLLLLVIVAGGGYYFLFMQKGTTKGSEVAKQVAQNEQPGTQNPAVNPEIIRKQQQLLSAWQKSNIETRNFYRVISDVTGIFSSATYPSNLRKAGNTISLTVIAPDRDHLAGLNRKFRNIPEVLKINYLNVSEMNINKNIMMVADIELKLGSMNASAGQIDLKQHISQNIQTLKGFFLQRGIRNMNFEFSVLNANPALPQKNYYCNISGKVPFATLTTLINQISTQFPQVEIKKMRAYTTGFKPLQQSNVKFYLNFIFHEANL